LTKAKYITIIHITAMLIAVVSNVFAFSETNLLDAEASFSTQVNDTFLLKCPEDISTYTDINECFSFISNGLNVLSPTNTLTKLTWRLTGATLDESGSSGINQLNEFQFNEGSTVITYVATDLANSTKTCSFEVIVSDNQVPRLASVHENITVSTELNDCSAIVTWDEPILIDNCASSTQMVKISSHNSGTTFPLGTTEVFYRINDGVESNELSFSFLVTVIDNEIPEFTAPFNRTSKCGEPIPDAFTSWTQFKNAGGVAYDNCKINYSSFRYVDQSADNVNCPYTVTRIYSIADENGNVAEVEHLIYVEGEEVAVSLKSAMTNYTAISGNWSNPATWGGGPIPTSLDNVIIPSGVTVTVDAASFCNNIDIQSGGTLDHSGATTLQVYGDLANSGTYTGGTNGVIEFAGTTSATISGTTTFEGLTISKGSLNTLLNIAGNTTVASSGILTVNSGLVTIGAAGSLSLNYSSGLSIPNTAGFDVTGGILNTGNFTVTNTGLIRIATGSIVNFGTNSGNEVHTQFTGAFIVSGGDVNIAGRLYSSATGTLPTLGLTSGISISGGTVTLSTVGNGLSSVGSLNVTSAGNFNFSGGTIVFQRPSTAAIELDLGLLSGTGTKNTSGGTFQFGNSSTPLSSTFNISSEIPLNSITSSANADLVLESDVLINDMSGLNSATTIDLNGFALQQEVTSTGTYTFPITDGSGNSIPVTVNLTSGSNIGSGDYIEVLTTDSKHGANKNTDNYLSQYWNINVSGITSPVYDVTATYHSSDVNGSEANIAMGSWPGSLPWTKYGAANSGAKTISTTGIINASIEFTGITLAPPTVTINNGDATAEICFGASTTLTAVATGDPIITYSWIPVTGLSATNISNPTASPVLTTTYTVTVTDGNGFTADDDIIITVNPLPTAPTAGNLIACFDGNTHTGSATVSAGEDVVWYNAASGGSLTTAPGGFAVGAYSAYATAKVTATGCESDTRTLVTVTINALPTVTLSTFTDVCVDAAAFSLSGGLPAGGSFSGTGVSGGNFTPSTAGVGTHAITYSYTDGNGCTNFATGNIVVNPLPTVTLLALTDVCVDAAAFALSGGSPVGGIYSGTGVSGGNFTPSTAGVGTYSITYTYTDGNSCTNFATADITVVPITTPTVTITAAPGNIICSGDNVTFTASPSNAGSVPTYQWKINGVDVGGETSSTYSSTTLANTQQVTVEITSDAPCPATTTSNIITMTVNPPLTPTVAILESANNICAGDPVNFSSIVVNGGAPTYQWQINGVDVGGATSASFSSSTLVNSDDVTVVVTSNATCAINNPATSNTIFMLVNPVLTPAVSIVASLTTICPGTLVTFTATPVNGGSNPTYQWKVNGVNVGSNSPIYTTSTLVDLDKVTVVLTSDATCAFPTIANSNEVDMTVNPGTPAIPGAITGNLLVCPGETSLIYSVIPVASATTYNWTLPTGWSITAGNNTESITVTGGATGEDGNITVSVTNSCGTSAVRTLAVTVGSESIAPTGVNITDNNTCFGTPKTLSVTGGSLGTGASWEWFTDGCGTTSAGTGTSITVNPLAGSSTTYYVRSTGTCNTTACADGTVVVSPAAPAQPGAITGTTPLCPGISGETYSIVAVTDATSYTWTVPIGWSITAGQNTISITVTGGAAGQNGNITVTATNSCGTSSANTLAVTVDDGTPAIPGAITGENEQCISTGGLVYSIDAVPTATTYNWTLPTGWTIDSGQGTTSITVSTDGSASSGIIGVTAGNTCETSAASELPVTIITAEPGVPGAITGTTAICPAKTEIYTIAAVSGATDYTWTVPTGWSITSGDGTTSITAQIPIGASSGNITVTANNICGSSVASSQPVTVDNSASVYAGPDQVVCFGTSQVTLAGDIDGAINLKTEWDWEAVNGGTINSPDKINSTYTFPAGFTSGVLTIVIIPDPAQVSCALANDSMTITVLPVPTASVSSTGPICEGESSTVTFTATANTTVTYNIDGGANQTIAVDASGTATLNTGALTSSTTYNLVSVEYTVTPNCTQSIISVSTTITVNPNATVDAGGPSVTCQSASPSPLTLSGVNFTEATTAAWSITSGGGTLSNTGFTATPSIVTYTPAADYTGEVILTLTTSDPDGAEPCVPVNDTRIITVNLAATVDAGGPDVVCESAAPAAITLSGAGFTGAVTAAWSITSGGGTLSSTAPTATPAIVTYTPAANYSGAVILSLTTDDPDGAGPCNAESATRIITVNV